VVTSGLGRVIKALLGLGVVVVAAAGNLASARRFYPAAFALEKAPDGGVPVISVGALNPNGTKAMFSNDGDWVTAFALGAAVVSTYPVDVDASRTPELRIPVNRRPPGDVPGREALDPNDYSGGAAVWSGTSFAAPHLAALITRSMLAGAERPGSGRRPPWIPCPGRADRMDDREPVTVPAGEPGRGTRMAILVNAARRGNDDALGEIVTELSPLLWHVARAAGLSSGDAEDVLQTVWMRLLSHLDGIRSPAALTGWLVVTAKREAWRVRAAERRQLPADQELFAALPDHAPGSEEQVVAGEQRRTLWAAFGRLSRRCQELLRIVAFVPRPDYAAVAAELGMPVGSIGPTRGRCLAKLRALLDHDPEWSP
jgi:RNA polymerase sigma factor (sigma-70 family)